MKGSNYLLLLLLRRWRLLRWGSGGDGRSHDELETAALLLQEELATGGSQGWEHLVEHQSARRSARSQLNYLACRSSGSGGYRLYGRRRCSRAAHKKSKLDTSKTYKLYYKIRLGLGLVCLFQVSSCLKLFFRAVQNCFKM